MAIPREEVGRMFEDLHRGFQETIAHRDAAIEGPKEQRQAERFDGRGSQEGAWREGDVGDKCNCVFARIHTEFP